MSNRINIKKSARVGLTTMSSPESINASERLENGIMPTFGAVFAPSPGTMTWSRVGNPALWPENTGQQGIISQDSLETAIPQLGDTRIRNGQKETYVKYGKP